MILNLSASSNKRKIKIFANSYIIILVLKNSSKQFLTQLIINFDK